MHRSNMQGGMVKGVASGNRNQPGSVSLTSGKKPHRSGAAYYVTIPDLLISSHSLETKSGQSKAQ